jgi:hypothetical protein
MHLPVDLAVEFCGIKSINPFWLASAPPTNTGEQIMRAFDAGWGGAVWKTLGDPIVNVTSRFGGIDLGPNKLMGLNNIELITDRPLDVNLRRGEEALPKAHHHCFADDRNQRRLACAHQARRRRRRRRTRAQLWLSARHVRARHGLLSRARAEAAGRNHGMDQRVRQNPCACEAHAQHRRYS